MTTETDVDRRAGIHYFYLFFKNSFFVHSGLVLVTRVTPYTPEDVWIFSLIFSVLTER